MSGIRKILSFLTLLSVLNACSSDSSPTAATSATTAGTTPGVAAGTSGVSTVTSDTGTDTAAASPIPVVATTPTSTTSNRGKTKSIWLGVGIGLAAGILGTIGAKLLLDQFGSSEKKVKAPGSGNTSPEASPDASPSAAPENSPSAKVLPPPPVEKPQPNVVISALKPATKPATDRAIACLIPSGSTAKISDWIKTVHQTASNVFAFPPPPKVEAVKIAKDSPLDHLLTIDLPNFLKSAALPLTMVAEKKESLPGDAELPFGLFWIKDNKGIIIAEGKMKDGNLIGKSNIFQDGKAVGFIEGGENHSILLYPGSTIASEQAAQVDFKLPPTSPIPTAPPVKPSSTGLLKNPETPESPNLDSGHQLGWLVGPKGLANFFKDGDKKTFTVHSEKVIKQPNTKDEDGLQLAQGYFVITDEIGQVIVSGHEKDGKLTDISSIFNNGKAFIKVTLTHDNSDSEATFESLVKDQPLAITPAKPTTNPVSP